MCGGGSSSRCGARFQRSVMTSRRVVQVVIASAVVLVIAAGVLVVHHAWARQEAASVARTVSKTSTRPRPLAPAAARRAAMEEKMKQVLGTAAGVDQGKEAEKFNALLQSVASGFTEIDVGQEPG